ncbi:MAG: HAMP domain-containing histidine kinase [Pontiellaceae bacterium]|nr:HAMP domain-containing histidine kinase [Pontiellaceae bacterium]
MKKSIRRQLMIALIMSTGTLMILGSGTFYILIERALLTQFDQALLMKTKMLTLFPEVERDGISLEFTERPLPEFERPELGEYYQIWLHGGTVLSKSHSLGNASLEPQYGTLENPVFRNIQLPGGRAGRAIGVGFLPTKEIKNHAVTDSPESPFAMILVFARDRTPLDHLLTEVRLGIIMTGCILLALTGWIVNRTLRNGLAPINRLTQEVESLDAHSLTSAQITTNHLPAEPIPIATELTSLIGRLNEAFQRERRLTSDIAHEINTPLSELRTASEVAMKWPDDSEITRNLAQQTLESVTNLQNVTGKLLELARQQNALSLDRYEVDLAALWAETRSRYAAKFQNRKLVLNEIFPAKALIKSDSVLLRIVLDNLLENAMEYSPDGAAIRCTLSVSADDSWRLVMENPNTALSHADLEHLFEPLWRHDSSRTSSKHCGLGLALVKTIAARLGMNVYACLPDPDTFRLVLDSSNEGSRTK